MIPLPAVGIVPRGRGVGRGRGGAAGGGSSSARVPSARNARNLLKAGSAAVRSQPRGAEPASAAVDMNALILEKLNEVTGKLGQMDSRLAAVELGPARPSAGMLPGSSASGNVGVASAEARRLLGLGSGGLGQATRPATMPGADNGHIALQLQHAAKEGERLVGRGKVQRQEHGVEAFFPRSCEERLRIGAGHRAGIADIKKCRNQLSL